MKKTLKGIREENKYTQIRAAKELGVALGSYRLWESGVGKPNPENMGKLVRLFGNDVLNIFQTGF